MPLPQRRRIQVLASQVCAGAVNFVSLDEAAKMKGVRVTMLPGAPAIWAEALKNFLDAKKVPYTRVQHPLGPEMGGPKDGQDALYKLTAQKSVPVMWYDDERPRSSWVEQMKLADNLGSGPSLIPSDAKDRVMMMGLMNELVGEDGAMYNKRRSGKKNPFLEKYGWSEQAAAEGPKKSAASLQLFVDQLRAQKAKGSKYLIGSSLSAVDVYFATCAMFMGCVPGTDIMPITKENKGLLKMFGTNSPEVQKVYDTDGGMDLIKEHQAYILKTYCTTPAVLGGTPA